MGDRSNFIELNGKRYNALTGDILDNGQEEPPAIHKPVKKPNPMSQSGKMLDGFTRRPSLTPHAPAIASGANLQHDYSTPKIKTAHRQPAHHAAHHAPQRSHTLMRRTVNKPVNKPWGSVHSSTTPITSNQPAQEVVHNFLSASHPKHHDHAKSVQKSALITKFSAIEPVVNKKLAPLKVKPIPAHIVAPVISHASAPLNTAAVEEPSNPFTHALEHATAHQHARLKSPRLHHRAARKLGVSTKVVTATSGLLAALLLGGFFAYQNMPNLALRLAASKAGFHAQMPGYRPSGFALTEPIQYGPGEITLSFKSNSDDRGYRLTQRPSDWNSETLLDNFVVSSREPYQTYQENGRTIYIYNDNNATWVNGGVWYVVAGDSSLNSNQLLRIASSL